MKFAKQTCCTVIASFFASLSASILASVLFVQNAPAIEPTAANGKTDQISAAIRLAAGRVLPAVVVVEPISAGDAKSGEVQLNAPTSGLVIDPDGYVLTSSLPADATSATILVTLADGQRYAADVVARDYHRELAMLKIDVPQPIAAVRLSDSPLPPVGSTTVAVARYSSAAVPMVASGILSATNRLEGVALQTDARVSPSFYGGPLIDIRGQILGVLIPAVGEAGAENPTDWYDSGVAFAIDAATISGKLSRLKDGRDIRKGLLGIVASGKDPNVFNTTLSAVRPRSPAEIAGLQAGDEITAIGDVAVKRFGGIKQALGRYDSGEVIQVTAIRDGEIKTFDVTLAETIDPLMPQRIGVLVRTETNSNGDDRLIIRDVLPGGAAAGVLEVDDQIVAWVDQGEPSRLVDVDGIRSRLMVSEAAAEIQLDIVRNEKTMRVDLTTKNVSDQREFPAPRWTRDQGRSSGGDGDGDNADADDNKNEKKQDGVDPGTWVASALDLPTASGIAAIAAPKVDPESDARQRPMSMLILLADEKSDDPVSLVNPWRSAASRSDTIVCVVTPSGSRGWQLKDVETIRSLIAAVGKKYDLYPGAIAISPLDFDDDKSTTSDRMVLASAFSMSALISGATLDGSTRPPAIRMKENSAAEPLQMALPLAADDDLPSFAQAMTNNGFPVLAVEKWSRKSLLNWAFGLQSL